jgi:hypothetical protein
VEVGKGLGCGEKGDPKNRRETLPESRDFAGEAVEALSPAAVLLVDALLEAKQYVLVDLGGRAIGDRKVALGLEERRVGEISASTVVVEEGGQRVGEVAGAWVGRGWAADEVAMKRPGIGVGGQRAGEMLDEAIELRVGAAGSIGTLEGQDGGKAAVFIEDDGRRSVGNDGEVRKTVDEAMA